MTRRALIGNGRDDRGTSLVEMLVTMVVTGVFLAVMGTAMMSVTGLSRDHTDQLGAQQSTRKAFLVLDKQIRYADVVTAPATISGDQWIEWQVPDAGIPVAQSATQRRCFQWRASSGTGLLQYRSWIVPTSGSVSTPVWVTAASDLVIGSQPVFTTSASGLTASPFSLPAANATYSLAFARVGVAVTVGKGSAAKTARASTIFSALNATSGTTAACGQVPRS